MGSQTIFVGTQASDQEIESLRRQGIEVHRENNGLALKGNPNWQPKTVTGLLNEATGEFIGFVLEEGKDNQQQSFKVVSWIKQKNP
ncbi:MAG: hypothetical protein UY08_C0003G0017 [Candidatus Gottesmanbacteria bacterium GW2011_GWA1_47_8]|uniref:Uncharacterized protein n=1 Tax=Candidatus Gottesmanbacteria bacterium GW2011_GWA1_47_8 TaxID=1618438 RepID=A0A0G1TH13_9BACT|nr:MAG: hypothetical protein UY08_C0003G0017 [Candidatus Gottesmanbacteria bacterium GW2011_GWA1_47_8]